MNAALPPIVSAPTVPVSKRLGSIPSKPNVDTSSATITAVAEPDIIPAISPIISQHRLAIYGAWRIMDMHSEAPFTRLDESE